MNQDKIWNYFETETNKAVFSASAPRLSYLFQQAQSHFPQNNPRILNIGIGDGWLEKRCQQAGWHTYTLDPSFDAIAKIKELGIGGETGYIEKNPYPDSFFDIVFCSEVIEHLSEEQISLGLLEIKRVLSDEGVLVGTVPHNENLSINQVVCPCCGKVFHRWGHLQSFNLSTLSQIFDRVLRLEDIKTIYFPIWSRNWKGNLTSLGKKIMSVLGIHGSDEHLFFIAKK